jgi:hypothetical protein
MSPGIARMQGDHRDHDNVYVSEILYPPAEQEY